MIFQIIGSPATGKSTLLKYCKERHKDWLLFDIAEYRNRISNEWLIAENRILKDIINSNRDRHCFIESVEGFNDLDSINIKLIADLERLENFHIKRNLNLDLEYYNLLDGISIKTHHAIHLNMNHTLEEEYFLLNEIIKLYI